MLLLPETDNTFIWILFWCFCGLAFIQLFWTYFFHLRIAIHREKPQGEFPPVSVIIAARNEEDNLFHLLPNLLTQDYPTYEVIVVNHQSSDDSSHILKAYQRQYAHLRVIELERSKHLRNGKKLPLTIAIKGAQYEHLLFTDADCEPTSRQWIQRMAEHFTPTKEIVLGYGPMKREKGLLNRLIRLDTTYIAMNYLSYAKAGVPYMGVGRNLGYTRRLFLEVDGFKSHYSLQSGDDDLFIQDAARKKNTAICLHPDSFCYSEAKTTWSDWYKQKSRHFTTTEKYRLFKKLLLGIYPLTLILLLVSFITLCLFYGMCIVSLATLAFVILSKWVIQGMVFHKLEQKSMIWALPIWDVFYAILAPTLYYTTEKSRDNQWK
jgi:cellulose synthase/poly-beta-1,6-N-acetylglucosamine synthase-like glycosyltransferase